MKQYFMTILIVVSLIGLPAAAQPPLNQIPTQKTIQVPTVNIVVKPTSLPIIHSNISALKVAWKINLNSQIGGFAYEYSLDPGGNRIFINLTGSDADTGLWKHRLISISASDGKILWTQMKQGFGSVGGLNPFGGPTLAGNIIVTTDGFGTLWGYDVNTGNQLWMNTIATSSSLGQVFNDGILVSTPGTLNVVTPGNGQITKTFRTEGTQVVTSTIVNGIVFGMSTLPNPIIYTTTNSFIRAFMYPGGNVYWEVRPTVAYGTQPIYDTGKVYWLTRSYVYAYDALYGNILWKNMCVDVNHYPYTFPLVVGSHLYCMVGGAEGNESIIALDKQTGAKVWQTSGLSIASHPRKQLPLINGLLFVPSWDKIAALDTSNGQKIWEFKSSTQVGYVDVAALSQCLVLMITTTDLYAFCIQ
jgi:outer membrane protein assembly factor BamB